MKSDFERSGGGAAASDGKDTALDRRRAYRIARLEEDKRRTLRDVEKDQQREAVRLGLQPAPAPDFVATGRDAASQTSAARDHFEKWRNERERVTRFYETEIEKIRDPAKFHASRARENAADVTGRDDAGNDRSSRFRRAFNAQSRDNDRGYER